MPDMVSFHAIQKLNLDLPPSCIAFCPTAPTYFVVGTYHLHPKEQPTSPIVDDDGSETDVSRPNASEQKRTGSLILLRLEGDTITQVATHEQEFAVLDLQWSPHSAASGNMLAVAWSAGQIVFYRFDTFGTQVDLVKLCAKTVARPDVLVLSLAWHPTKPNSVGLTLSDGNVRICHIEDGLRWTEDALINFDDIHQHDLEAWTLAFVRTHNTVDVMSGGDDIQLQYTSITSEVLKRWQDRKLHQAGITAILPLSSTLAVTGSYDDHIRLISFTGGRRRQILAEYNLGGGVWRLKLLAPSCLSSAEGVGLNGAADVSESKSLVILASCMHAGSRIVRLHVCKDSGDDDWAFEVMGKFEEHKSMNYGSDIQPGNSSTKSIVSTSFYDKLLCLWRFDLSRTTESMISTCS